MTTFKDAHSRFGLGPAGGDPPLTIYGLHAASTTLPTAAITGTATGGTSSSFTTLIGTATGYGELWGLVNAGAWAAGGSLPAPDGHGWILDSTLLEGQLLQAGTFTMAHRLATSAAYTTFTATLYGRVYKYNGGTYTQIGPTMSVAANLTTTKTTYTLSATMPDTYFSTGDKLYFDTFLQITASTGGSGTTTVGVSNSSDAALGIVNQAQLTTAGYLPGNAKDTPARFQLVKAQDALARFGLQSGGTPATYIPRVFGGTIKIASSITSASRDALARFRLLATRSVDQALRFRQQSAVQNRDAASRLRLLAATSVSAASRLRLRSTQQLKDVLARFRLVKALDAASRLRLLAATSKSLSSRFRLNTPSALTMAWIYPGSPACNAPFEYADGRRIDVLKPQYYALQSDGTLVQNTVALSGCNGYSAANATDIKAYSTQQFVTISGLTPGMDALATDSTKTTNFINTLTAFLTANGFTGIELDFEGFGLSSMSATQYADYKTLVTTLGNALHASGFKLMIDGPAIFNSTYQGFYRWHWEDFDTLPVDYLVVLCYDFQFDNGAGTAVAPLATITSTCTWMQSKITDPNRIVIGLNSYGYHGATGSFAGMIIDTQVQSQSLPGFGTATRDAGSGEMMWATGGVSYDYSDITTLDGKRAAVYATGLRNISVWHLGGNQWFSNVMANTASRFRLQPAVLPHDLQSRLRLLATRSVDQALRFRQQSAVQNKDAASRLRLLATRSVDMAARYRMQSGLIPHDLRSRLRLLSTTSRDVISRLRVQSPLQNKDAQSRLRLLAARSLDVVARYRQLATKSVDSMGRFRLQSGILTHDALSRFRAQSGTQSKDSQSRFRLIKVLDAVSRFRLIKALDAVSRFRQQSGVLTHDLQSRLRVLATKSLDTLTRYRLQSGLINHDLQSRLRVQSSLQQKDAQSRLRLLATKSVDTLSRFRQLATKSVDTLSRFRQLATKSADTISRFRLGIPRAPDVLSRFRQQSGTTARDLQARFRLQQVGARSLDILSRFRQQSGTTYHDLQARYRLVITPLRDVISRLRVQSSLQNKDAQSRLRVLATKSADTIARYRQLATKSLDGLSRFRVQSAQVLFKDSLARYRQLATRNADQTVRFRQHSTVQSKDSPFRLRLLATKSLDGLARLRVQSPAVLKDVRIRFTLLAVTSVSVIARLRVQSALVARDVLSRFRLVKALDTSARFRLVKTLDAQVRFRLQVLNQRTVDVQSRFRQLATKSADAISRFRQQSGVLTHDAVSRFRLRRALDAIARLRLLATKSLDSIARFRLILFIQVKDAQVRFSLTSQALSSAGTIPIILTFRDGSAELTFRDGVAEDTFR